MARYRRTIRRIARELPSPFVRLQEVADMVGALLGTLFWLGLLSSGAIALWLRLIPPPDSAWLIVLGYPSIGFGVLLLIVAFRLQSRLNAVLDDLPYMLAVQPTVIQQDQEKEVVNRVDFRIANKASKPVKYQVKLIRLFTEKPSRLVMPINNGGVLYAQSENTWGMPLLLEDRVQEIRVKFVIAYGYALDRATRELESEFVIKLGESRWFPNIQEVEVDYAFTDEPPRLEETLISSTSGA